jgi:hypothetical protein
MVHSSTLTITTDGEQLMGGGFSPSEVIRLGSLEFTADHFDILSLSPEGSDSGTVFVGMAHNESPSLHAILEESVGEDDSTSSEGGSFGFPISQDCHVVISVVPIATTPPPEGTPTSLSIPMVLSWTTVPQLDTGLPPPPKRLRAYQEEEQHILQADIKHRAEQQWAKLSGERAAIEA